MAYGLVIMKNKILKRLTQIEKELEKNNTLDDFYTFQRRAKKERKRDYLAMEKFKLKQELEKYE